MSETGFGLVIFDCDGVLVDSEVITSRIFAQMLREIGLDVTLEEVFEQFVGVTTARCLELIEARLGGPLPAGFLDRCEELTTLALKSELKPVAGIEAVLEELTIPYCVASNGTHAKMNTTLGLTGLLARFEGKRVSVSDVARGKPFPDVFLRSAQNFKVAPRDCAVVEDTPTGVAAGVAAGMTVFGYCAHMPARRLREAGAHHTFGRMQELPLRLAKGPCG